MQFYVWYLFHASIHISCLVDGRQDVRILPAIDQTIKLNINEKSAHFVGFYKYRRAPVSAVSIIRGPK
jgi:hypothetical protein